MENCGYCSERDKKMKKYIEDLEREKIEECQKALEREKISKGIQSTRENELRLREMQKMQMQEKKYIEQEEENINYMWHQILIDNVRKKEEAEKRDEERRQREMLERRMAYDEQISSANRKRQETLREEREKENIRLERMKKKMEQDHYDAIKRKKEQQTINKQNFIQGHELKLSRLKEEKSQERELDNKTIRKAMEELTKEKQRRIAEMHYLQMEKEIFKENINRERRIASELEEEADKIANEWKKMYEDKTDEYIRKKENDKKINKEVTAQAYRRHLAEMKNKLEQERLKRKERMEIVKRNAFKELQRRLDNANEEIKKQINYRNSLRAQIMDNQKYMEIESNNLERKEKPFTKKSEMFKDAMRNKYKTSSARTSTNPVHPFKKLIETQEAKKQMVQLPLIEKR